MISSFSIILENDVLYCSDENKYKAFEIVLFVEKLMKFFRWRLKNICLKSRKKKRERIIVEHVITNAGQNLFFCCVGNFNVGSRESFNMLREFLSDNLDYFYKTL